jgi:hypothetical protein|tara:strand:+ start:314 stop:571 length:258 start_codon:yes stop_codon:yes gene_type:complete
MTQRVRRSPEQWQEIVDGQMDSGLSAKQYCGVHQLCYPVFCKWRRKLSSGQPTPFVDVSALVTTERQWDIELVLGDGMALRLRRG